MDYIDNGCERCFCAVCGLCGLAISGIAFLMGDLILLSAGLLLACVWLNLARK